MVAQPFDVEASAPRPFIRRAKRTARWWAYQRRRAGSDRRRCRDTSPILMAGSLHSRAPGNEASPPALDIVTASKLPWTHPSGA
jgi:hypothetical protein